MEPSYALHTKDRLKQARDPYIRQQLEAPDHIMS